ncbi:MAG: FtsW/RodA/SpoVE family cell cycle protein [Solibacillus sp.]
MSSKQYLKQVTSYMRSKEARGYVETELQQHITHSKEAWLNKGYSAEEAEQKAIAEMGSASQLGKSMDKIHRPKWDFWLIGAVLLLVAASFVPILTVDVSMKYGDGMTDYFIKRKIVHILVAIALIAFLMLVDYRKIQRFIVPIYGIAIALLLILVLMPNASINGMAMYIIGPIRIQAWVTLPLFLVAFAGFLMERKWKLWQLIGLFIIPLLLFMMLPNLAVAIFYSAVVSVQFAFSTFSNQQKRNVFLTIAGLTSVVIVYMVYAYKSILAPYQIERIRAFLHPEMYADTSGYLMLQLKTALAEAGWFGAETTTYLPEAHTDYALVQLIQAYGYLAGILVIIVLLAIALRILWLIRTMPQSFGKLLVLAAVTLYSCQSVYSILMIFGLLPLAGIPLPFISYGVTPFLLNTFLIGLVLSVYRRKSYMGQRTFSA